jgi:hypothetical protein
MIESRPSTQLSRSRLFCSPLPPTGTNAGVRTSAMWAWRIPRRARAVVEAVTSRSSSGSASRRAEGVARALSTRPVQPPSPSMPGERHHKREQRRARAEVEVRIPAARRPAELELRDEQQPPAPCTICCCCTVSTAHRGRADREARLGHRSTSPRASTVARSTPRPVSCASSVSVAAGRRGVEAT